MRGSALEKAETVDGALAPALTRWDLKILCAVPAHVDLHVLLREKGQHGFTVWRVGEAAREMDLEAVLATLSGLQQRWLVTALGYETGRRPRRWIRTELGDEKVAA